MTGDGALLCVCFRRLPEMWVICGRPLSPCWSTRSWSARVSAASCESSSLITEQQQPTSCNWMDMVCVCVCTRSELMKEDYTEIVHKKTEVLHLCNFCTQILERTEQL